MNCPKFNYAMAMPTPWGKADSVEKCGPFLFVTTPSHGGIMIGRKIAEKHLTRTAQRLGTRSGAFLCYEEDCLASIPMYEKPELFYRLFSGYKSAEELRESSRETIKRWNPEYFDILESEAKRFIDSHFHVVHISEAGAKVSAAVSKAMADVFKTM
jgi:hypothetical protein